MKCAFEEKTKTHFEERQRIFCELNEEQLINKQ